MSGQDARNFEDDAQTVTDLILSFTEVWGAKGKETEVALAGESVEIKDLSLFFLLKYFYVAVNKGASTEINKDKDPAAEDKEPTAEDLMPFLVDQLLSKLHWTYKQGQDGSYGDVGDSEGEAQLAQLAAVKNIDLTFIDSGITGAESYFMTTLNMAMSHIKNTTEASVAAEAAEEAAKAAAKAAKAAAVAAPAAAAEKAATEAAAPAQSSSSSSKAAAAAEVVSY